MVLQPVPAWFKVSIIPTTEVSSKDYDGLFWPVRGDVSNADMLLNFQFSVKLIAQAASQVLPTANIPI